jgi:hypothetical protein
MVREEKLRYWRVVTELFAKAIERGDIRGEDPAILAAVVIGASHSLLFTFCANGKDDRFDTIPDIIDSLILDPLETKRTERLSTPGMEESR